jgi:hypothetical protein
MVVSGRMGREMKREGRGKREEESGNDVVRLMRDGHLDHCRDDRSHLPDEHRPAFLFPLASFLVFAARCSVSHHPTSFVVLLIMKSTVGDVIFWIALACGVVGQLAVLHAVGAARGRVGRGELA